MKYGNDSTVSGGGNTQIPHWRHRTTESISNYDQNVKDLDGKVGVVQDHVHKGKTPFFLSSDREVAEWIAEVVHNSISRHHSC